MFYVEDIGWIPANMLEKGDILSLEDGRELPIQSIKTVEYNYYISVYNFEVEDYHTYYVSYESVLVHNMCAAKKTTTIINEMKKQIKKGQAPRGIIRIDSEKPSTGTKLHVHFKDGTALNYDGTIHDGKNGIPKLSGKQIDWLKKYGWNTNIKK